MKKSFQFFCLFVTLLLQVYQVSAQTQKKYGIANEDSNLPEGLSVGETAPLFELKTSDGKSINLESELKSSPVVLVFYRGQWCGNCIRYLSAIQDSLDLIYETGAKIFAISPELAENAENTKSESGAEFPVLLDENDVVMDAYKVGFEVTSSYSSKVALGKMTSIASANGQENARLPVPATYIIDQKGIIRFVHFDYNYKYDNRMKVWRMIEVINRLEG